ncbi:MAG: cytochrome c [Calditrichaceae bacterium]
MDKRPVLFFSVLLFLAFMLVVVYQIKTDPFKQIVKVNQNNVAANQQNHNHDFDEAMALYAKSCATCHGSFGEGRGSNPTLQKNGLSVDQIKTVILSGRGNMPPIPGIKEPALSKLAEFVTRL